MKALIVPDLPEWERQKYTMLKILKPGEIVLFPYSWGADKIRGNINVWYPHLVSKVRTYNRLKYLAVKNNAAHLQ